MIVFIANYPIGDETKEGMAQRIIHIDNEAKNFDRIYLDLSFRKHWKKSETTVNDVKTLHLNSIVHIHYLIFYILNAKSIYVHSIFNFIRIAHLFPILFFKKIILDLHGVVPEELLYENKSFHSKLFNFIELLAVLSSKRIICVTNSMKNFIKKKYKFLYKKDYLLLPILNELNNDIDNDILETVKKKYQINDNDIVIIYAGNTQKWQNVDLMIEFVKKYKDIEKVKFIFLTNEINKFKSLFLSNNLIINKGIYIDSVSKEDLPIYYSLATYGFILRDNHILNKVSNPTKLSEYLQFGIIPIVLSEDIGDYKEMGYEYIKVDNINNELFQFQLMKSYENIKIINLLKEIFLKNRKDIFDKESN